jgi:hypothetical protein
MQVKQGFTPEMLLWVRLVVQNASRKEIFQKLFHVDIENTPPQEQNKYDVKMSRWRHHPDYPKEWLKAFREQWGDILSEATDVLKEGLHDESLPWRRTQHANLALAYGTKLLVGDDEKTVHVQIEGMPEIGSPDDE